MESAEMERLLTERLAGEAEQEFPGWPLARDRDGWIAVWCAEQVAASSLMDVRGQLRRRRKAGRRAELDQ